MPTSEPGARASLSLWQCCPNLGAGTRSLLAVFAYCDALVSETILCCFGALNTAMFEAQQ